MLRESLWVSRSDAIRVTAEGGSMVRLEVVPAEGEIASITFTGRPDQLATLLREMLRALEAETQIPVVAEMRRPAKAIARQLEQEAKSA